MDKIQEEYSSYSLLLNFSCHINLHMASTQLFSAIYVRRHQKRKSRIVRSDDVVTNAAAQHYCVEFEPASTSDVIIAANTAEVEISTHFDVFSDDVDQGDVDQGIDTLPLYDKGGVDAKAKDDDNKEVSKICIQRFNHCMDQIVAKPSNNTGVVPFSALSLSQAYSIYIQIHFP